MKRMALLILSVAMLLWGCTQIDRETAGRPKVVVSVTARYDSGEIRLERKYTQDEKMQAVLLYFRCLKVYAPLPSHPEETAGSNAQIRIDFSDGSSKVYRQFADQYLQVDGGQWHYIDPEQGQELGLLLGMLSGDEII